MFQGGSKSFNYYFGRFFFWGLALLWMAVIFAFSSQANSGAYTEAYLQDANVPIRKLAHMFEFAVLAVLYQTALVGSLMPPREAEQERVAEQQRVAEQERVAEQVKGAEQKSKNSLKNYLFAFVLAVLYVLTDEWHQAFVPGRSASLLDSGVDAIGALVGLSAVYW
ncbi:VanZ family protein, partial [bacterium]|nr:VanZ family protein [bacterium]